MPYVLDFTDTAPDAISLVGGKGANLAALSGVPGILVPAGFIVTTRAYQDIVATDPIVTPLLADLATVTSPDPAAIGGRAAALRATIARLTLPPALAGEIAGHLERHKDVRSFAVRSSATAEDLPGASFAGQQDTYLNVIGTDAILKAVAACWASLFTDRAVAYRIRNGFDHSAVALAVVIQEMVFPAAAGVMFTADPVNSNRNTVSIDAGFGLGEALVSGLVTADNYKVRAGAVTARTVADKQLQILPSPAGGTQQAPLEPARRSAAVLTDEQTLHLADLGRTIEAHFGRPQDIEWALMPGGRRFAILQARPITTLYPLPETQDDKNHVYVSFNHQQMMTDAMKPIGLSFMQMAESTMVAIGGRLYMELAHDLATPSGRMVAKPALKLMDPLVASGVDQLLKRKDFVRGLARGKKFLSMGSGYFSWALIRQTIRSLRHPDPGVVPRLIEQFERSARQLDAELAPLTGVALMERIREEYVKVGKLISAPDTMATVWVGTMTASWINKRGERWLDEKGIADGLVQSVPYNNTSEMGLALLDVADAIREQPAVIDYLTHPADATFFADLAGLPGGDVAARAIGAYLDRFGARCVGEIDITRPRWHEHPSALAPLILANIRNFGPGGRTVRHEAGLAEYLRRRDDIMTQLGPTSGRGKQMAAKIDTLRAFSGFREYPKHAMMLMYWAIKRALLREAQSLVSAGVIPQADDVFHLSLDEMAEAVRTGRTDPELIEKRKADFLAYEKLTPPRLMTSEGEIFEGTYGSRDLPPGALAGIAVSRGVAEGRARVIRRPGDAALRPGDILVTAYTDPSWTPVFVSIRALVTEVGGVATHGSVIAREYGLPAVVGVPDATTRIQDGQPIRVNGTEGWVELL